MREKKIILSFYEETPDGVEPSSLGCECFAEPHEAKAFIERNMRAEADDLKEKAILESGDPMRMWEPGRGKLEYKIGDHRYVYAWNHIGGDGSGSTSSRTTSTPTARTRSTMRWRKGWLRRCTATARTRCGNS